MNKFSYIVGYKRTPIGSFMGSLSSVEAPRLAASIIKDMIQDLNIDPSKFGQVVMGNVLQAGIGQAPARQAAIYSGLPNSVCATTINKVCGSGLQSIVYADNQIRLGESSLILAGGMENMSKVPHYFNNSRVGTKLGNQSIIDGMIHDGLWDPYSSIHMGSCAEELAESRGYTREIQDSYASMSYERALKAIDSGLMKDEISKVIISDRKNELVVSSDEEPGKFRPEKISALRPAFNKEGTITAANASSISDGAACVILSSLDTCDRIRIEPAARIVAHSSIAHEPIKFTTAPIEAIKKVLLLAELTIEDIDLFEINEAFACVPMVAIDDLGLDINKVNVHGGAIALGHPIGASGTRILVTLLNSLKHYNRQYGLATLCIGGGEGIAIIVENLSFENK